MEKIPKWGTSWFVLSSTYFRVIKSRSMRPSLQSQA